jgi:hypothetical protein
MLMLDDITSIVFISAAMSSRTGVKVLRIGMQD